MKTKNNPVNVPSVLSCAADTLDAFKCEDADYYRSEFAKIEAIVKAAEELDAAYDLNRNDSAAGIRNVRAKRELLSQAFVKATKKN